MGSLGLFVLALSFYIAFLVISGIYFSKKTHSLTDFWLAGKGAGWLPLGFSSAASWLTAGALLAVTGFFMLLGAGSIWGFVTPNILALIGIAFFVSKIRQVPAITQPELLELRYGKGIRLPVAMIITVVMILFAVSDIKGFALVLEIFYGVSPVYSALIVGLAVAVYVTLGGLSAVIATDIIQFLCLCGFILFMTFITLSGASDTAGMNFAELAGNVPENWWNPMSIGLPMVMIFIIAIVPGWITEQDPWQRVWAAKDNASARKGMLFGAVLVSIVFGGCCLIALSLNVLYPEIAAMGFPMGMAKAEPALLSFILDRGFSDMALALCAVALATAAMSCADTFAASGGSCISRDIYQRQIKPHATLKEMRRVNRISVLIIVGLATLGSFFINNIIDAIHMATFIASASYVFPLMGGLYWKRATREGATLSMITGFVLESSMIVLDLVKTVPMAPPFLESIHPVFMGHGVIIAMAASGLVFVLVSLATKPSEEMRLAPFFSDAAEKLVTQVGEHISVDSELLSLIDVRILGNRTILQMEVEEASGFSWQNLIKQLMDTGSWAAMAGTDTIRYYFRSNSVNFVSLSRGETSQALRLELEGDALDIDTLKTHMLSAHVLVCQVLQSQAVGE